MDLLVIFIFFFFGGGCVRTRRTPPVYGPDLIFKLSYLILVLLLKGQYRHDQQDMESEYLFWINLRDWK